MKKEKKSATVFMLIISQESSKPVPQFGPCDLAQLSLVFFPGILVIKPNYENMWSYVNLCNRLYNLYTTAKTTFTKLSSKCPCC